MIDITFPREDGPEGLKKALHRVTDEATQAAKAGYQLVILSDRKAGDSRQVPLKIASLFVKCTLFDVVIFISIPMFGVLFQVTYQCYHGPWCYTPSSN